MTQVRSFFCMFSTFFRLIGIGIAAFIVLYVIMSSGFNQWMEVNPFDSQMINTIFWISIFNIMFILGPSFLLIYDLFYQTNSETFAKAHEHAQQIVEKVLSTKDDETK